MSFATMILDGCGKVGSFPCLLRGVLERARRQGGNERVACCSFDGAFLIRTCATRLLSLWPLKWLLTSDDFAALIGGCLVFVDLASDDSESREHVSLL